MTHIESNYYTSNIYNFNLILQINPRSVFPLARAKEKPSSLLLFISHTLFTLSSAAVSHHLGYCRFLLPRKKG
ncbi:hypothetical protein K1719_017540 [Acacia pycnantha]|nr:hypothetical protein K1719_017540 [Acacia pycnantha]